jgi:hypothetical protein
MVRSWDTSAVAMDDPVSPIAQRGKNVAEIRRLKPIVQNAAGIEPLAEAVEPHAQRDVLHDKLLDDFGSRRASSRKLAKNCVLVIYPRRRFELGFRRDKAVVAPHEGLKGHVIGVRRTKRKGPVRVLFLRLLVLSPAPHLPFHPNAGQLIF